MKYIDTHCHLNFAVYEPDLDEVIQRTTEGEVAVINIGTQQTTSHKAVALAEQYDHFHAIVGLHPIHTTESYHDEDEIGTEGDTFTSRGEVFDTEYYRSLITSSDKVVGIGECGLDYYRNTKETKKAQETAFRAQIELACEYNLPLMLHVRPSQDSYDAYYDTFNILKEYQDRHPNLRGQLHFFAGTPDIADHYIDLGFYISFTGVVTFAKEYEALIAHVPLNRILSETDAPYVTPAPYRGQRNEPVHVREVVKTIARVKGIDEEIVAKQIKENVKNLYSFTF